MKQPLFRVKVEHGLTQQDVMMRAPLPGVALDRVLAQLQADGIKFIIRASATAVDKQI